MKIVRIVTIYNNTGDALASLVFNGGTLPLSCQELITNNGFNYSVRESILAEYPSEIISGVQATIVALGGGLK